MVQVPANLITGRQTTAEELIEVDVTVRWSDGLTERVTGIAVAWCPAAVYTRWSGGRYGGRKEVWLDPGQVKRRLTSSRPAGRARSASVNETTRPDDPFTRPR